MELTNSKRLLYAASYVSTKFTPEEQKDFESTPGGGFVKLNTLQSLELKSRDLIRLQEKVGAEGVPQRRNELRELLSTSQKLTERSMSTMELAAEIAPISYDALTHFVELCSSIADSSKNISFPLLLFIIEQRKTISPIGRIHLERIEMYPAGVQKGELVFSIPMAPGETVAISHKEWTTTTRGFEDIVQDFFENYSERGVAEKTDAAMSSENDRQHSSALNFGASLSGSYTGVTLTTTLGITDTNQERQSIKQSMQKNREVTEKASARTRKEHKVSMKLETKMGTEDHSGKTITNPAPTAIRIDYYRMMRKWRTDLYRYGLRQTYDIAIPLPGVRLWALHQRVAELDKELRTPFAFGLKPEDISRANYQEKAIELSTTIQAPPLEIMKDQPIYGRIDYIEQAAANITRFGQIAIDVPAGYFIAENPPPKLEARLALWAAAGTQIPYPNAFAVLGGALQDPLVYDKSLDVHVRKAKLSQIEGKSGHSEVAYSYAYLSSATIEITLTYKLLEDAWEKWQYVAWSQLRAAAEARYHEELARKQEERDRLWRLLNGKDTLSLRRLEREELLRLVMQWLLGPTYRVVSTDTVQITMEQLLGNEETFQISPKSLDSPTFTYIEEGEWSEALVFGDFIKFIHQAVEWENLLYFLYPYFWGSERIGRDKMLFEHADPEHERFLRAGYARVVLPVRPGFEEDFTSLLEKGSLPMIQTSPYITIAQDIANFARTNYAGIPPANPELHARPLLFPEQRATWDTMQKVMKEIDAFKVKNGHYPEKLEELPTGPGHAFPSMPVDAWGNPFVYKMPGLGADYDLVSLGADNKVGGEGLDADISSAAGASLMATWFDYTPTSALDIEIDTKPEDMA
jgi:hypothetical protein